MKRFLLSCFFALFATTGTLVAQSDDYFYDPSTDNSYSGPSTNPQEESSDYTDGYGSAADRYDSTDESGNTYITNNYYYDSEDEDFFYTSRVRRFYTPNWGVNYYSYWFTPGFYYGWNTWNAALSVSFGNPWYYDTWWHWNRWGRSRFTAYDPWFDPYWSYNWGWNGCNLYNTWNNPWYGGGFCAVPNIWNFGWGGAGCGGFGWGNNYWNGYNQGYWNGYQDGYWNSPYGFNNGWGWGPHWRKAQPDHDHGGNPHTGASPVVYQSNPVPKGTVGLTSGEIPKEGITKPFVPASTPPSATNGLKNYDLKTGDDLTKGKAGVQLKPESATIGITGKNEQDINLGKGEQFGVPNTGNNATTPMRPNQAPGTGRLNPGYTERPASRPPLQQPQGQPSPQWGGNGSKPSDSRTNGSYQQAPRQSNPEVVRPAQPQRNYEQRMPAQQPPARKWGSTTPTETQRNHNYQPQRQSPGIQPPARRAEPASPRQENRSYQPPRSFSPQSGGRPPAQAPGGYEQRRPMNVSPSAPPARNYDNRGAQPAPGAGGRQMFRR